VATPEGQELRIYDLRTQRRHVWLRAATINAPLWSPRGDRLVVRVQDGPRAALVIGSPGAATAPDTLMRADERGDALDAVEFHDDTTILARDVRSFAAFRIDPSKRPVRVDTLLRDGIFPEISPDGKHLAWHSDVTNQLFVGSYPPGGRQRTIAAGGVEPLWLAPNDLLFRSGVTWYRARLDPATGELTGPPTVWARDTRFLDTPGWSNRPSWDGGIIYSQSATSGGARYLRFIPDFTARVKAAADGAKR
jgi:hypothetical protein